MDCWLFAITPLCAATSPSCVSRFWANQLVVPALLHAAVGAMVEYLFARGRHRLIAQTDMRNAATQKLLEKLRFRREAMHLQSWAEDGKWYDEVAYARLASE